MLTPPQFLLRGLDRPWLKFGPVRAPKSKTDFFGVGKLLAMVLWRGFLGFVLGILLGRLLFGEWIAWPSGVLAGLAACQALVIYGLAAICWNQRAARLSAGPEPAATPKGGVVAWILRASLALFYALVIWWVTPLALFLTFENIRGEWAWHNERAHLVAAGEKLSLREVLGPDVPLAQNAGAAAIFAPVFDYTRFVRDTNQPANAPTQTRWADTNAMRALSQRFWLPQQTSPTKGKLAQTPRVNFDEWVEYYRHAADKRDDWTPSWVKELRLPEGTNDSARVVLSCLDHISPGLAEIDAAARLPRARFPVHCEEGFQALLPHIAHFKSATRALELRCAARLATGQTNLAAEDVESAMRVAELAREEPFLISQLVRDAQWDIAAATLWQGLALHAWNEPQLARWQDAFLAVNFRKSLAAAFESERIAALSSLDELIDSPGNGYLESQSGSWSTLRAFGGMFFARGFLRQNEVALSHFSQTVVHGVRRWTQTTPPGSLVDLLPTFAAAEGERTRQTASFSPYRVMMQMLAPSTRNSAIKMARAEAVTRMAAIACALERYRLARGAYPESLAALSPAIMAVVPLDPVNNQPFHYTKSDDGWFLLYSVGKNCIDDGGIYRKGKEHDVLDWPWPVPTRPALENLF